MPQKARGKRKAGDSGGDTSLPSDVGRSTRGALGTWMQKSLGHYDQPDDSHTDMQDNRGPPGVLHSGDFVPARSLPSDGTPLCEIPEQPGLLVQQVGARLEEQIKDYHAHVFIGEEVQDRERGGEEWTDWLEGRLDTSLERMLP